MEAARPLSSSALHPSIRQFQDSFRSRSPLLPCRRASETTWHQRNPASVQSLRASAQARSRRQTPATQRNEYEVGGGAASRPVLHSPSSDLPSSTPGFIKAAALLLGAGGLLAGALGAEAVGLAARAAEVAATKAGGVLPQLAEAMAAVEVPAAAAVQSAVLSGQALREACAQEFGGTDLDTVIAVAAVVEGIALAGAAVGGYIARQRKLEVEKINTQLRQININLRKQARVESYAPALSYAPVGSPASIAALTLASTPASSQPEASAQFVNGSGAVPAEVTPLDARKEEVIKILKEGKKHLRSGDNAGAGVEFKKALALAQELGDLVEEKKAARGVGAALQRQGKYEEAIKYHQLVLLRSRQRKEHSGDTEAYGAIADCFTELGDLENAAKYYDKYIAHLEDED